MRKHIKKGISLVVLTALIGSSLMGCKSKPEATNADNTKEVAVENQNFNETGMPIVNEPVTLKVLTTRWGAMGDSFAQNEFLKQLEKNSNVKIEWQAQSLNDWDEQKAILLAGGDIPDVIIGSRTFNDKDVTNNKELFLSLDQIINDHMPNYKKALDTNPDLKKTVTYLDGHMYSMGKNLPLRPTVANQPIINKTWLDNLGLEVPTTIEELETVLKAFKEQDANGNGDPDDEIPITGAKGIQLELLNPFGLTDIYGSQMMVSDSDELTYYPTSDLYKEGIKWLHKLYKQGLLDSEAFTQDDTMVSGKYKDPNVARVGFSYQWTPDAVFGQWSDQYIAIAPIAGFDGQRYAGGDSNGIFGLDRGEAMIAASCEYPEVAARWLDEFYTGEASIQNFWGAIGTVINKTDDGTYVLNDPPEGTSADAWYWDQSLRDFGPKYVSKDFESKIKLSSDSGDGLKLEISKLAEEHITKPYPKVFNTEEEIEELATLETDLNKFVEITRAQWIIEGGIDEGWDNYVDQLKAMGLEEFIKIRQEAFDRYQSAK